MAMSIFMHNNAPIHSADSVQEWFKANPYTVMNWLPYLPDLNPIEHCWQPLKENVHQLLPNPIHLPAVEAEQSLQIMLLIAWFLIPQSHYDKLIKSMPARVKTVIDSGR